MTFWDLNGPALQTFACYCEASARAYSYEELNARVAEIQAAISGPRKNLIFHFCENSFDALAIYLACLRSKQAVLLLPAQQPIELARSLIEKFVPDRIFSKNSDLPDAVYESGPSFGAYRIFNRRTPADAEPIFPELAVLLSTSGTTGSSKLVRLSYRNLVANAASIAQYLALTVEERAITSLPFSYSYGLSIINSHLLSGAGLTLTNSSLVTGKFWETFRAQRCTSLAGVPFTYEMLNRLRFEKMELPSLKTLTQAGGRLNPELIEKFCAAASQKAIRFFVMYGQTEATARISYVPSEQLAHKIGSIGVAIPDGRLGVFDGDSEITTPLATGELVYRGENVMLGYAGSRACLAKGDELHGELRTGDLGYFDNNGFFYVTGRLKRFLKIHGLRLNLDEIETLLETRCRCAVACTGQDDLLTVYLEAVQPKTAEEATATLENILHLHRSVFKLNLIAKLPRASNGKKDYQSLAN